MYSNHIPADQGIDEFKPLPVDQGIIALSCHRRSSSSDLSTTGQEQLLHDKFSRYDAVNTC